MDKKVSDLTIEELKGVVREVITEEMMKYNFISPTYIPTPQPYYCPCQPAHPYQHQEVWATTNTVESPEMLKKRTKYSLNTILKYEGKVRDRGNKDVY